MSDDAKKIMKNKSLSHFEGKVYYFWSHLFLIILCISGKQHWIIDSINQLYALNRSINRASRLTLVMIRDKHYHKRHTNIWEWSSRYIYSSTT